MRSCIYCGRELKDGEQCGCPAAVARRAAKAKESGGSAQSETKDSKGGYYRTGYTNDDGRIKRSWERHKAKRESRRNSHHVKNGSMREIFSYIARFIKSPAEEIANPKDFSLWQMTLIAAVQGAVIGLCVYFTATDASRGWFRTLANIMGLGGINGYRMLMYAAIYTFSGAISGAVFFYVHAGIFWLVNKFIFRSYSTFTAFSQRLVLTNVPFTVFAAAGVLFAFFSTTTLMILLLCGALSSFVLTYVSLKEEWSAYSESRVMYSMILGYFILFTFICSLLRLSAIGG